MDNFSLSDIKAVTDNENGFGGNGGIFWILILFIVLFGGGFGGWGGSREQAATAAEVQAGFNQQTTTGKLDQLAYGLSNAGYENAQLTNNVINNMTQGFMGLAQQISDCCCSTKQEILTSRYDSQNLACQLQQAIHAEGENTRALIRTNREKMLEDENAVLRLNSALCGVVRYPNATTYTAGAWPFATNNCCGGTTF